MVYFHSKNVLNKDYLKTDKTETATWAKTQTLTNYLIRVLLNKTDQGWEVECIYWIFVNKIGRNIRKSKLTTGWYFYILKLTQDQAPNCTQKALQMVEIHNRRRSLGLASDNITTHTSQLAERDWLPWFGFKNPVFISDSS